DGARAPGVRRPVVPRGRRAGGLLRERRQGQLPLRGEALEGDPVVKLLDEWAEGAPEPPSREELDDTRDLLARLRDLPPEGDEPAGPVLERAIHDRIDAEAKSWRGWLRRLWKPALGLALATTAAAIVLVVHRDDRGPAPQAAAPAPDAGAARPTHTPTPAP